MDPAIVVFGFAVGALVGFVGVGGGSLMTPFLVLIFGVQPVTAIGTDIFYSAVTKTVGGARHLRLGTVDRPIAWWLAAGSVPSAVVGVFLIELIERRYGSGYEDVVLALLAAALIAVGGAVLVNTLFLERALAARERETVRLRRRHRIAAVSIGAATGFVIGLTSAGSGTLVAIMLILVFALAPHRVVGTDIFHAALVLWAASLAHLAGGNIDFGLAGTILVGSVPGVLLGSQFSPRAPRRLLRSVLAVVILGSGVALVARAGTDLAPLTAAATVAFGGFLLAYPLIARRLLPLVRGEDARE